MDDTGKLGNVSPIPKDDDDSHSSGPTGMNIISCIFAIYIELY